jgi:hypothetical protein
VVIAAGFSPLRPTETGGRFHDAGAVIPWGTRCIAERTLAYGFEACKRPGVIDDFSCLFMLRRGKAIRIE